MRLTRRSFLSSLTAAATTPLLSCNLGDSAAIPVRMVGHGAERGHLLRFGEFPKPEGVREIDVAIVGAGISGLSAAYALQKRGIKDLILLELEDVAGGNSCSGTFSRTNAPWGAHYLPVPNEEATEVRELLVELGLTKGFNAEGRPIYDEVHLCHAPESRLFIHGRWQDGIIPNVGVADSDRREYDRFFALMNRFREARGADGKRCFSIPVSLSSQDPEYLKLDGITFEEFLRSEGFSSPYLFWYANYCCRDDYGTTSQRISAWAGIHYFASRNAYAADFSGYELLTWPEGNGWLAKQLAARNAERIRTAQLVYRIEQNRERVEILSFDTGSGVSHRYRARHCIYSAPRFTSKRVIAGFDSGFAAPEYNPWMVSNISVKEFQNDGAESLPWDSVIYQSNSLGYINARHQELGRYDGETTLTYYLPLTQLLPKEAREAALARTAEDWAQEIVSDLSRPHRDIGKKIQAIDIRLWGHAMVSPLPGLLWGGLRGEMKKSFGRIHFAHTDMSGMSIFEEGLYQGYRAAERVLNS